MTIAFRPLRNPNPLEFPGSQPAIDWSHPAALNLRFSAVASGGSFINLLSGNRGAVGGGAAAGLRRTLGITEEFSASGDKVTFTGQKTTNDASVTIAAIVRTDTQTSGMVIFSSSDTNAGWRLDDNSGQLRLTAGGENTLDGPVVIADSGSYFLAASGNTAASAFVVRDLRTGAVSSASAGGTIADAPSGTYVIGNITGPQPWVGGISAVMFAARFMPLPGLLAWAADPWSFWYPRRDTVLVGSAAAAAFKAYWAQQNNLPVIGTGTY